PHPRARTNRCSDASCERAGATPAERLAERVFRRLSDAKGRFAQHLPEIALVRVGAPGGDAAASTLVHARKPTNVAAIFREQARLAPDEDRVTILPGIAGSYPNFVFDVAAGAPQAFVDLRPAVAGP